MEFVSRYPQPFTIEVAAQLGIEEITNEIARLQLSVQKLKETQNELEPYVTGSSPHDKDLEDAYNENRTTIGSQEERITMLRFALQRKGGSLASNPHYDLPAQPVAVSSTQARPASSAPASAPNPPSATPNTASESTEDGGVYL